MSVHTDTLLATLVRLHDFCASVADELVQDYTGEAKDDLRAAVAYVDGTALPASIKQYISQQLDAARAEIFGAARNIPACGEVISKLRRQLANEIAARLGQTLPYNDTYYPRLQLDH
jgi:hypothetical protein